ncbi:MAG: hypothetical protein FWG77_09505 [Treponema sp.]|nr:hypothetical protein [Treponema sp.]
MKMTSRHAFIIISLLIGIFTLIGQNLEAQEREIVRLFDITGGDFAITMNGERTVYPIEAIRRGRVILERTGIVHTGPETFMDVLLIPSGTLIRVAENTSLIYNGLSPTGDYEDFALIYGRVRVIAGNRTRPIVIRGGNASTRIMEGDFGIDHLIEEDEWDTASRPLLRVNAFSGNAEFYAGGSLARFDSTQAQIVLEGQSASAIEVGEMDEVLLAYWDMNMPDFWGQPRVIFSLIPQPYAIGNRGKNTALTIGLAMTIASAATLAISYPQFEIISNRDLARNINNAAYVPLGMGLLTTLGGILYNPLRP